MTAPTCYCNGPTVCIPCDDRQREITIDRAEREYPQNFAWTVHTTQEYKTEDWDFWALGVIMQLYKRLDAADANIATMQGLCNRLVDRVYGPEVLAARDELEKLSDRAEQAGFRLSVSFGFPQGWPSILPYFELLIEEGGGRVFEIQPEDDTVAGYVRAVQLAVSLCEVE